jgi:hypothetical protein
MGLRGFTHIDSDRIKEIRTTREKLEKPLTIAHREIRDAASKFRALSDLGSHADDDERKLAVQYKQSLLKWRTKARALADEIECLRDRELALGRRLALGHQYDVEKQMRSSEPAKKPIQRIRCKAPKPITRRHLTLVWVNPNISKAEYRV